MKLSNIIAAGILATSARAHMEMSWPPPLRSKFNSKAVQSTIDYSMTAPLAGDGSNFPCKGYNVDMASPTGGGASVVTWKAGSSYNFTITGGADHHGGSCQAALSYDQGKTFKVIHSYIGSCPPPGTSNFQLAIPSDATTGSAMFAWTWFNTVGNREIYMNCASITIDGPSGARAAAAVPFSSRPDLFIANLGNGCTTVENKEVIFPDPGPDADITTKKAVADDSGSFTGTCKAVKGVGGGGGASPANGSSGSKEPGSSSGSSSTAPVAPPQSSPTSVVSISVVPSSLATSSTPNTLVTTTSGVAQPTSTSVAGSLKISVNGECSGSQTCKGSAFGQCCSSFGYCGVGDAWCGAGCQPAFGECGKYLNATNPVKERSWTGRFLRV